MIDEYWFNGLGVVLFFLVFLQGWFGVSCSDFRFKKRANLKPIRFRLSEKDRLLHKKIDRAIFD